VIPPETACIERLGTRRQKAWFKLMVGPVLLVGSPQPPITRTIRLLYDNVPK